MIQLLKGIYKLSEKQIYKAGEKVDFGTKENKALVEDGRAVFVEVLKPTKVKKQVIKKK